MRVKKAVSVQHELGLDDETEADSTANAKRLAARSGTFTDNMKLPIHRWFRYSAGFSAEWAASVIESRKIGNRLPRVLDPFAGAGTTVVVAAALGADAIGIEHHSFVARLGRAKLLSPPRPGQLPRAADELLATAKNVRDRITWEDSADLLRRCYSRDALISLESLREAWHVHNDKSDIAELLWLGITSILRACSNVATAQWQYVLPSKGKAKPTEPYGAFTAKIWEIVTDLSHVWQTKGLSRPVTAEIREADARDINAYGDFKYDLVLTSPPYPNNYDYADATRIEMTFWREISGWGDLQAKVRHKLVRSCSQHSAAERLELAPLLNQDVLDPIRGELATVCNELAEVRMHRGGRKTYHSMVAAYFVDLAQVIRNLSACRRANSEICMVIGDSAPYGVYVPVDRWLAEIGSSFGFATSRFEKIRDRNIKWKNRKHRVPLKEGALWLS